MQDLSSLIGKTLAGNASAAELEELLTRLDTEEGQLYSNWIREADAANGTPVTAPFDQQRIRAVLTAAVQADQAAPVVAMEATRHRNRWWKVVAAAAVLMGLICMGYYYWQPASSTKRALATKEELSVLHRISAGNIPKTIVLRDSSVVVLYPNSSLEYDRTYGDADRKLRLVGKGRFTVQKDPQRPFVVYSKHVATTAIGTVFEVTEAGDSTVVCLLEGKVKVENYTAAVANPVLLTAGERAVSHGAAPIAVASMRQGIVDHATASSSPRNATAQSLSFRQMALADVFELLKKRYKINIHYNKQELAGMLFTGTFEGQERAEVVLRVITNINDLQLQTDQQGFTITK